MASKKLPAIAGFPSARSTPQPAYNHGPGSLHDNSSASPQLLPATTPRGTSSGLGNFDLVRAPDAPSKKEQASLAAPKTPPPASLLSNVDNAAVRTGGPPTAATAAAAASGAIGLQLRRPLQRDGSKPSAIPNAGLGIDTAPNATPKHSFATQTGAGSAAVASGETATSPVAPSAPGPSPAPAPPVHVKIPASDASAVERMLLSPTAERRTRLSGVMRPSGRIPNHGSSPSIPAFAAYTTTANAHQPAATASSGGAATQPPQSAKTAAPPSTAPDALNHSLRGQMLRNRIASKEKASVASVTATSSTPAVAVGSTAEQSALPGSSVEQNDSGRGVLARPMSIAALSSAPTPIMASNAPVTARMTEAASTTAIASNLPANAHASVDMLASRPRPGTFQSHSYRHTQANMQSQPQLQTVVLPAESQPQLLSLRHTAAGVPLQTDSLSTRMPQTSVLNVIPLSPRSSRARPRGLSASTKDRVSPAASDRSIDGMIDSKPSLADQTSNPTVISRSKSPLPSPRSSTRTPATISLASHLDQATNTVARSLSEVASNPQPNPGGDRDLKTAQVDHDQKHASLMGKVRHRKSSASSQIGLVINSTTASSAHLGGKQVSSPVDISAPVKLRRRLSDPAQSLQDLASTRQGHRARSSSQGQGYYSQDENIANDVDDLDDGSAESSHEPDQPIRLASKASIKRAVKNLGIATEVIRLLSKRQNTPSAQMKLLSSQRRNSMQSIGPAKAFGIVAIMGEMAEETRSTTSTMSDIDRKEANSAMAEAEMIKRSIHRRWRVANAGIVLGLRFARIYKDTIKRFQDVKMAPVVETTGLSYMLRSHQGQGDTNLSAKVREVLDGNRERTKEAIEQLERTLSIRIRSFARFTLNQRLQFCEIMHYERFPKETLLVKEGHVSWAFYFILNGQVEIFKIKDKLKYRLNVLNSGDSFGDRTMNMLNDKRTACVATTMDTDLLRIDKEDFFKIANATDERNITHKIALLSTIPFLAGSDSGFLERAAYFFKKITYDPNEIVLFEGTDTLDLFWILKGSCRCVKTVPFIQKTIKIGFSAARSHIRPYEQGMQLGEDEEVIEQLLLVQDLEVGDRFPDIPMDPSIEEGGRMDLRKFREQYLQYLSNLDPASEKTKSYVSVIANSKVEVMAISRLDYCKLASPEMVGKLVEEPSVFRIPVSQLQESYMKQRSWQIFKKKVVGEVLTRKK